MIRAVAYVPPGIRGDYQFARECLDHLDRRDYENGGIFRSMDDVRRALNDGATLVVFAREVHWSPAFRVPSEFVGDETVRLAWSIPPCDRLSARRPNHNGSAVPGEKTVNLDHHNRPSLPRRRNDHATQLVELAARRMGFPAAGGQSGWGPANY